MTSGCNEHPQIARHIAKLSLAAQKINAMSNEDCKEKTTNRKTMAMQGKTANYQV
jgi:hypothetical protein